MFIWMLLVKTYIFVMLMILLKCNKNSKFTNFNGGKKRLLHLISFLHLKHFWIVTTLIFSNLTKHKYFCNHIFGHRKKLYIKHILLFYCKSPLYDKYVVFFLGQSQHTFTVWFVMLLNHQTNEHQLQPLLNSFQFEA